jgi:nickel-dependent lactate racemase
MRVDLAYGTGGLVVEVPDDATVVVPHDEPALADEAAAVVRALRDPWSGPPLSALVRPGEHVAVVFPDLTRPMPNRTVLPPLLAELERLGAGPGAVDLLCATGTHRPATAAEMAQLVGPDIVARYRVVDHRADDGRHVMVGRVDGVPVLLDARYVSAPVRITTGFVEPHFFAGYSGGPKAVCPGLAATETILEAHSPARIAARSATFTVTRGNPVHDFVRAAVDLCPPTLSLDVTIDRSRRLTGVFAGPLPDAHQAACRAVEASSVQRVGERFDVVLATNGGHPLDRNLYQAVKGMAAAERVVTDGGVIVLAAPCGDGIPSGSAFERLLRVAAADDHGAGPDGAARAGLLDPSAPSALDRWQAQVLARVLARAEVWLFAEGLTDDEVAAVGLRPVPDVGRAVAEALAAAGPGARLAVLPQGPLTVATVGPAPPPP